MRYTAAAGTQPTYAPFLIVGVALTLLGLSVILRYGPTTRAALALVPSRLPSLPNGCTSARRTARRRSLFGRSPRSRWRYEASSRRYARRAALDDDERPHELTPRFAGELAHETAPPRQPSQARASAPATAQPPAPARTPDRIPPSSGSDSLLPRTGGASPLPHGVSSSETLQARLVTSVGCDAQEAVAGEEDRTHAAHRPGSRERSPVRRPSPARRPGRPASESSTAR